MNSCTITKLNQLHCRGTQGLQYVSFSFFQTSIVPLKSQNDDFLDKKDAVYKRPVLNGILCSGETERGLCSPTPPEQAALFRSSPTLLQSTHAGRKQLHHAGGVSKWKKHTRLLPFVLNLYDNEAHTWQKHTVSRRGSGSLGERCGWRCGPVIWRGGGAWKFSSEDVIEDSSNNGQTGKHIMLTTTINGFVVGDVVREILCFVYLDRKTAGGWKLSEALAVPVDHIEPVQRTNNEELC